MRKFTAFICLIFVAVFLTSSSVVDSAGVLINEETSTEADSVLSASVEVLLSNNKIPKNAARKIAEIFPENKIDYVKEKTDSDGINFFRIFIGTDYYDIYLVGDSVALCTDENENIIFVDTEKEATLIRIKKMKNFLVLKSITENIKSGEKASLSLKNMPVGKLCNIEVVYPSGNKSKSKSLIQKEVDENGEVSWSWNIPSQVSVGVVNITVSGEDFVYKYQINITE